MKAHIILDTIVPCDTSRQSVNHIMKQQHISQRMRRKLKTEGIITVNGSSASWDTILHGGDRLVIALRPEDHLNATPIDLDIIYEDAYILVINKASGVLMHPTSTVRDGTLANGVLHYYRQTGQHVDFHPVHRLDKNTSGIVIIAKTAIVQHAFERRKTGFQKVYDAITDGYIPADHLTLKWPVGRKPGSIIERHCTPAGKMARTDMTVLKRTPLFTHVRCLLHTGRTHQIRVHLAQLGHPITGDDMYGGSLDYTQTQALHAGYVAFTHPMTQKRLELYAKMPKEMQKLLALCPNS